MGFIGCSERQPSWLSEFSEFSVAGGGLAGWIRWQCQISDINHQPPPLPPLLLPLLSLPLSAALLLSSPPLILLHPTSAVRARQHESPLHIAIHPLFLPVCASASCISLYFSFCPLLILKLTCTNSAAADKQTVQALL